MSGYLYSEHECPEHDFGSNDEQPVDDHCSRCGLLWVPPASESWGARAQGAGGGFAPRVAALGDSRSELPRVLSPARSGPVKPCGA